MEEKMFYEKIIFYEEIPLARVKLAAVKIDFKLI